MSGEEIVWTGERNALLREHWGKMPASKISEIIFDDPARKNAVLGQAWRMKLGKGWQKPPSTKSNAERQREGRAKRKAKRMRSKEEAPVSPPEAIQIATPLPQRLSVPSWKVARSQLIRRSSELRAALRISSRY